MTEIHAGVRHCDGSPRVAVELNNRGVPCSGNVVAGLMKARGLRAGMAKRFVRTTDSRHGLPVAANVPDRGFTPAGPNEAWAAGITYLPTADGWLYLAVVGELFSRRIVGGSSAGRWTRRRRRADWWSVPSTWRWAVVTPRPGCWPTRIGAARTRARMTRGSSARTASRAA